MRESRQSRIESNIIYALWYDSKHNGMLFLGHNLFSSLALAKKMNAAICAVIGDELRVSDKIILVPDYDVDDVRSGAYRLTLEIYINGRRYERVDSLTLDKRGFNITVEDGVIITIPCKDLFRTMHLYNDIFMHNIYDFKSSKDLERKRKECNGEY